MYLETDIPGIPAVNIPLSRLGEMSWSEVNGMANPVYPMATTQMSPSMAMMRRRSLRSMVWGRLGHSGRSGLVLHQWVALEVWRLSQNGGVGGTCSVNSMRESVVDR